MNRCHGSRDRTPLRPHRPRGRGRRACCGVAVPGLLASIRQRRSVITEQEIATVREIAEWAAEHIVDDEAEAAATLIERGLDTGLPLAGPGAPLISDFAVMELSALLGRSLDSGRNYVGQVIELAHRLPRPWARVLDGEVPVWKALRVADHTRLLPSDAAGSWTGNSLPMRTAAAGRRSTASSRKHS